MSRVIDGRSEAEAVRQYIEPFQQAIAAFAENIVFTQSRPNPKTLVRALTIASVEVVMLQDGDGALRLAVGIELGFRAVQLPGQPRRWTVETAKYIYHLNEPARPTRKLVGYHWHPEVEGITFPHIHMYAAEGAARKLHVATPHSTIKEVLTTAMRDYAVAPRERHRDNWAALLQAADETLQASMGWAMPARPA